MSFYQNLLVDKSTWNRWIKDSPFVTQTLSLYYERSIEKDGDQLYVMEQHTHKDAKWNQFFCISTFTQERDLLLLLLFSFILRSSVKLNYFLRELGLDGKGAS